MKLALLLSIRDLCHYPIVLVGRKKYAGYKSLVSCITLLGMGLLTSPVIAQTDFAPGEIMFTGYRSDDPDGFSFVILKDVVAGTTIYITDRGWDNSIGDGFRDDQFGEGTISFVFTNAHPCGSEFFFADIGGTNDWQARDANNNIVGTVTILTSTTESPLQDVDGPELGTDGDQLFIYQDPEPNPENQSSFITAIHMNGNWNTNNDFDNTSEKPTALDNDEVVRFGGLWDNAKYDCDTYIGLPSFLQSVITNDNGSGANIADGANNWIESNDAFSIAAPCFFCCGNSTPPIPFISSLSPVLTNQMFAIYIDGTLPPGESWQLFLGGCGNGAPIMTTTADSFLLTAPSTSQTITYYIRSTEDSGCECGIIPVCFVASLNTTCSSCSADPIICGDCYLPHPAPNPVLASGCHEQKLIFILDESGSINVPINYVPQVTNAVISFLEALNGQEIEAAVIEFSTVGTLVTNYAVINNAFIMNMQNYFNGTGFNGQTYSPLGCTNWHDAMVEADALDPAGLILFFTDGEPTCWLNGALCGDGQNTNTPEIVNPVKIANKLKGEGAHIFMLGVGGGILEPNLQAMSGITEYESGVNTIGTSDYSIGNFNTLADELEEFVFELCETTTDFEKTVTGDPCGGVVHFTFTINNTGNQSATTTFFVYDTFPTGYANPVHNGPPEPKLCVGLGCDHGIPNAFQWGVAPIPPGESRSITITVNVLPDGNYENIAWAFGANGDILSDTATLDSIIMDQDPLIDCPPDVTVSCTANTLPPGTGVATATDAESADPVVTYSDNITGGSCPGTFIISRTWMATDSCMNTSACVQMVVVNDITPPILNCPPDISVQCNEDLSMTMTGMATGSDNCDPSVAITFSDISLNGDCPQSYIIQRTWTGSDDCGNSATCIQTISIVDSTPPAMICPLDVTVNCGASTSPQATGVAKATDNCDVVIDFTYEDILQGCPENFTLIRIWTGTDDCGNSATCQQVITIIDVNPPQITCPVNITIQCTDSTDPDFTGEAFSTDNCDPDPELIHTDIIIPGSCASSYTIMRTWTASDEGCNSVSCTQTITVSDNTAPVLTCPADVTIACNAVTLPIATGAATADDNCDDLVTPVFTDVITNGQCPQEYVITRTWTSTDDCGNEANCDQVITVIDTLAPVVICASDITIACNSVTLPSVTGTTEGTDSCDGSITTIYNDDVVAGDCDHAYTINRTWTLSDDCSNMTTCHQIITVIDNVAPVITCPVNLTIACNEDFSPSSTGEPVVSDNCDNAPAVNFSDNIIPGPSPNGTTVQRTWTATDVCGNASSCIQIIQIDNPLDPSITGFTYDTICSGQSVSFSTIPQSISPATYTWNFGEGSAPPGADGPGPHIVSYTTNGSNGTAGAHVLLTITAAGCLSVTDTVGNVLVNPIPNPAIDAPVGPLCYFRKRTFKPLAPIMPGFTYQWNFGAGASVPPISGYGPHQVSYSTTGSKTVQLIVASNAAGVSCIDTATITFNVLACPGNITGIVRREDGTGIAGVNVRLFPDVNRDGLSDGGLPVRSVNTNSMGIYSMATLIPGQYVIVETQPAGFYSFFDGDESNDNDSTVLVNSSIDDIIPVTIEPQEIDADNNFVDVPNPGIINGYVFEDMDNDEMPDDGEGIQGVTIHVFHDNDLNGIADSGTPLATTVTNDLGWYAFGNMLNGSYVVAEVQPAGYISVKDFDPSIDDDLVPNTNMMNDTIPVTILNGETDADNYFMESASCSHLVTTLEDEGPGSLRYIILCASPGDTIRFHNNLAGEVIYLLEQIEIDKNLFIHSDIVPRVMIESQAAGAFKILAGITVEFRNLNFTSGLGGNNGAAFENHGHLIIWDVSVFKNALLPAGDYLFFNTSPAIISAKGLIKLESD